MAANKQQEQQIATKPEVTPLTTLLTKRLQGSGEIREYREVIKQIAPNGKANFPLILDHGTPIAYLVRSAGDNAAAAILMMILKAFSDSVNVVRNLMPAQIEELAWDFILNDEWGFKIEDYLAAFEMAKVGTIGDIRDRLDIQVINQILDEYFTYRMSAIRERREQRQLSAPVIERLPGDPLGAAIDKLTGHFIATKGELKNEQ